MSRYHIAKGLAEQLLPGVKESLSRAISHLNPQDQAGLAGTLAKAIREAVESHQQEAERRRRIRDMMRQYDKNTREVGASRGQPRHRARLPVESAVEAWHGTRNLDFGTFSRAFTSGQLGFHFGTEEQATGLLGEDEAVPRVIRVELDIENPLRMPDLGGWTGHAAKAEFERALGVSIPGSGSDASIVRAVRAAGHDGVVYANRFEGEGDSYIVFDPSQIRIVGDARAPRSIKSLSARTRGWKRMSYARISKMMSYARITKMAQRHQPTTDVRHPFYELGDKLRALREAVASDWVMVDDPALGTLLDGLTRTHDALHRHLNANYLWD